MDEIKLKMRGRQSRKNRKAFLAKVAEDYSAVCPSFDAKKYMDKVRQNLRMVEEGRFASSMSVDVRLSNGGNMGYSLGRVWGGAVEGNIYGSEVYPLTVKWYIKDV